MKKIILGKKNHKTKQEEVNKERKTRELENRETRKEDITKRSVYAKHYNNEDGTFTMELNSEPIHFFDDDTKQYEDIDNTFEEDDTSLKLTRNSFKLDFSKDLENNQVLRMNKGKSSISLKYFGKKEKNNIHGPRKSRAKARNSDKLTNSIVYEEIAPNVDLEYIVSHNTVKENIVIKEKQESYEFSFELNVGDHKVQLSSDEKNIELVDANNQVQFIIPAPVMLDEAGNTSDDVSYDLEDLDNGTLILNVKADASWINADERVLPVKIDPQFISVEFKKAELKQYEITSLNFINETITQIYSGGSIGSFIATGRGRVHYKYMFEVPRTDLLKHEIIHAQLLIELEGVNDRIINIGHYKNPISTDPSYNPSYYENLGNLEKHHTKNEFEYSGISLAKIIRSLHVERKNTVAFVLKLEDETKSAMASIKSLVLTIQYKSRIKQPDDYIVLGQRTIVEIVSDFDVELSDQQAEELKIGILTSVIDTENEKVYQNFQVDNQISVRENTDSTKWNKWKKIGLCARYLDEVLFLDEEVGENHGN